MITQKKFALSLALLFTYSTLSVGPLHADEKTTAYKAALSQMRVTKDSVKGITWYEDKTSPKYLNANGFYLYVGTAKGSSPTLRLKIQYYGDDWLFIERYFFNVDGVTNSIEPSYGDVEQDSDSNVWEWFDTIPNKNEVALVKSIIKSKKAVMRIEGSKYYKDFVISNTQKKALERVLTVFSGLNGK